MAAPSNFVSRGSEKRRKTRRTVAFPLLLLPCYFISKTHFQSSICLAFSSAPLKTTPQKGRWGRSMMTLSRPEIRMTSRDQNERADSREENNGPLSVSEATPLSSSSNTTPRSSKRVGRRTRTSRGSKIENDNKKFVLPAAVAAAVLALFTLLSRLFLPGPASNPNFVYYSSSVYETRNYDASTGKMVTNRQENFKSNIPGLKGQFSEQPDQDIGSPNVNRLSPSTSSSVLTLRPQSTFSAPREDYEDVVRSMDELDAAINKEMVKMFKDFWN